MRRTAASLLAIACLTAAAAADAQSFDCRNARYPDEHVICKDPYLSKLDEQLSGTFAKALNQLPSRDQKELADDEEDWVASRHQCGADSRCIAEEYRTRIRELTGVAPPPGRANPPVAGFAPREPDQPPTGTLPPARQAGPAPERPPFPVVERPLQPPFPAVERPLQPPPVVERAPPPASERPAKPEMVEQEPLPKVVGQQHSGPAEQRPPGQKPQTTVTVREPQTPERDVQSGPEIREPASAERREQQNTEPAAERRQEVKEEARPQPTAERKPPAALSGTSNAGKEDRQERKSLSHQAGRTTGENISAPEPAAPERTTDTAKPTSRRHHKPKQDRAAPTGGATAAATAAPAMPNPPRSASATPSTGSGPAKPSIQWVDPPPTR